MPKLIDITGKIFGRLIVIKIVYCYKHNRNTWLCRCVCGNEKTIRSGDLRSGRTRSCGCLLRETTITRSTIHGHCTRSRYSRTRKSWDHMTQRCHNTNDKDYPRYGGRGIEVCDRWKQFINFLEDMGEPPTSKHTLDRIDNNQNYCKSNCRWATRKEQSRNKRNNHVVTFNGRTQCLCDWSEELGIGSSLLRYRLKHWTIEKTFMTSVKKQKRRMK